MPKNTGDVTNPFDQPGSIDAGTVPDPTKNPAGNINPSGPTTGTEGWGNGRDEQMVGSNNPSSTVPGKEGGGNLRAAGTRNQGRRTFRCADVGNSDCRFEVSGQSEDELMPQIERHGREAHGWKDFDAETKNKMRNAMRERKAA